MLERFVVNFILPAWSFFYIRAEDITCYLCTQINLDEAEAVAAGSGIQEQEVKATLVCLKDGGFVRSEMLFCPTQL